ncbi:MAG: hypothetical protein ACJ748_16970 [Flavisolibacter sp.]
MILYQIRSLIILLFPACCFCQINTNDTANKQSSNSYNIQLYSKLVGGSSQLYNGSEYTGSYPDVTGFPFYASEEFQKGYIGYDHIMYYNIPIAYDLVANEIIIKGYQGLNVKLLNERIDSFSIMNHVFINLITDSTNLKLPAPGFYELAYNGTIKLLIKRRKQIERAFKTEDPYHFTQYDIYYILKDGNYLNIDNKRTLFNVFKERNKEINSFYKASKLKFKKEPEKTIIRITSWYDQLKK